MASYLAPLNPSLTVFVPQYWEYGSGYLTQQTGNQLYLLLNGNETVGGLVKFQGGLAVDTIQPIANGDALSITTTGSINFSSSTINLNGTSSTANNQTGLYATSSSQLELYAGGNIVGSFSNSGITFNEVVNFTGGITNNGQTITTSPGGSSTQIQYNSNGAFAGSSSLTFNSSTNTLMTTNLISSQSTFYDTALIQSQNYPNNYPTLTLKGGSQNYGSIQFQNSSGTNQALIYANNTLDALIIDTQGNSFAVNSNGNTLISSDSNANFFIGTSSFYVDSTNNQVGINNLNPNYTLDVDGIVNATSYYLNGSLWNPSASASAGGSNTQIQYNSNGSLSGNSGLTYNSTTNTLTTTGTIQTNTITSTGNLVMTAPVSNININASTGNIAFSANSGTGAVITSGVPTIQQSTTYYNAGIYVFSGYINQGATQTISLPCSGMVFVCCSNSDGWTTFAQGAFFAYTNTGYLTVSNTSIPISTGTLSISIQNTYPTSLDDGVSVFYNVWLLSDGTNNA